MEKLIAFDFTIIYCKRAKNLIDGLFRRSNFKDDSELSATRHQFFLSFLFKFQEYLGGTKNDPAEEQSIDFGKTLLFGSVLNLIRVLQGINSIGVLLIRSESKSDPTKEQSIDFGKTLLFGNVLSLVGILQGINSVRVLLVRSESRDKCSGFVLDSIGCNQMKIPYLKLVFIIKKNNN